MLQGNIDGAIVRERFYLCEEYFHMAKAMFWTPTCLERALWQHLYAVMGTSIRLRSDLLAKREETFRRLKQSEHRKSAK